MIKDAEAHAEEDRARKEEAETRNQGDSQVYQIEKMLRDNGDKLAEDDKTRLEAAVATLKEALAGTDSEAIKRATEELGTAGQAAGQKLYEQAAASAQAAGGGEGGSAGSGSSDSSRPSDDDIVDAEIVDEK